MPRGVAPVLGWPPLRRSSGTFAAVFSSRTGRGGDTANTLGSATSSPDRFGGELGPMHRLRRSFWGALLLAAAVGAATLPRPAMAASAAEINRDVSKVLKALYAKNAAAKSLGAKAKGILVFPSIVKGGFMVGGQYGEGALRQGNRTVGYYSSAAASYGLQAGLQKFGYALFFMTPSSLDYLQKSSGWEVGVGPSIVVVDQGMAKSLTTTE